MNMAMADEPVLRTPYPLGALGDGDALPADQAANTIWDNTPWTVKLGGALGLVTKDKFTSGFSMLSNQGYQLVQSNSAPANAFSPDGLFSAISDLVTNDSDRQKLNSGQSYLTQTVQNLQGKGYYFVKSGSSAPSGGGSQMQPSAPSSSNSFTSAVSSITAPITALFSPASSPSYQRSGYRAGGLKVAPRGWSQKSKNQVLWAVAIGGVLLIGVVLISSVD